MIGFTPAEQAIRDHTDAPPHPPTERERYIALLAGLGALLGKHPEVPQPYTGTTIHFIVFSGDALAIIATIRRAIGGKWDKQPQENAKDDYFDFLGEWHGFPVQVTTYREAVCRKVVKGTELRPVEKVVQAAVTETVMEPTEIVEWICEPVLAPRPAVADEAPKAVEAA